MNLNYRVHEGAHHLGCDASLWTLFVPFKDKRKVSQGGKQMRLNGETKTLKDPVALSDFLTQEGFSDKRIAVERNGEIVPKGEYANVILSDSDTLEIVAFVGGG